MKSPKRKREKKFSGYMRLKKLSERQQRLNNLGSIIHWAGFLCLIMSIVLVLITLLDGRVTWIEPLKGFSSLMFDGENLGYLHSGGEPGFWVFWLSVTHWPIKLILSSKKSLFPWGKN